MSEQDEKPPLHLQSAELGAIRTAVAGLAQKVEPTAALAAKHEEEISGRDGIRQVLQDHEHRIAAQEKRLDTWLNVAIAHMLVVWTAVIGFLGWLVQSLISTDKGGQ